ncbi:Retrovirus-related Pol polyprotein from transposon RE1 [Vitis vinifera]|uniref:Retrovirus-related Pol polyprotein from transposon RE1 n=1 Tax=Vitis vinifera TaxID=29760 RepID=A0A438GQT4_VITVI|nr:Retrovirus-related Pol polyprotein from transposon RE1 [Vitis vinifera]
MIVGTNNKIIIIKGVNFKEEAEDVEATTQQLIDQSQQTSSILNVTYVIDTGCSNHMCGEKKAFSDLDESFCSSVKFGDNSTISVMGKEKELCDLPKGQKTIGVKWVYKTKLKENGEVDKHKARLVAKGYNSKLIAYLPIGREISIPPWRFERREDLIYMGNNIAMFRSFKKSMMAEFEMFDLGMMHYFLGIEVMQSSTRIFISQKKYVQEILDRFQMKDCNPVNAPSEFGMKLNKNNGGKKVDDTLYKQIVESLMYLMATRPDIMHVVSVISRYMECPIEIHFLVVKRIFQYLQGTKEFGLFYKNEDNPDLFGFIDSDYVGDLNDRKKHIWVCFHDGDWSRFMVIKEATYCHIIIH